MVTLVILLFVLALFFVLLRGTAADQVMPGIAGGLYWNGGNYSSPTWLEQFIPRDVKPTSGWEMPFAQSRETPVKLYTKATIDMPIQVIVRADPGNTQFAAWMTLHWSRLAGWEDTLVLNAKIGVQGAQGFRGQYFYSLTEEPQDVGETIYATFELRPTIDSLGGFPVSVVMNANSVPIFTSIAYNS